MEWFVLLLYWTIFYLKTCVTSNSLISTKFGYFLTELLKFDSSTVWLDTLSDDKMCLNCITQNLNRKHGI